MMGLNTTLMICNDGLDQLKADPEAGKKIAVGVLRAHGDEPHSVAIGNHCNPVTILSSHHADQTQLVLVRSNYILPVHVFHNRDYTRVPSQSLDERVLKALADELGYNLTKKAWRKRLDAQ